MIDEDAGQLLADSLMDEDRGDRRIDAAGETAEHPGLADLRSDFVDRLLLEGAHGPIAATARNIAHEIANEGCAMRRMHHFEMELGGVELAFLVRDHGDGRVAGRGNNVETLRQPGDTVAMAHPHGIAFSLSPCALEKWRIPRHQHLSAAEFAMMASLDLASELRSHRLLAVANAQYGNAGVVEGRWRQRRVLIQDRGGPAGKD